MATASRRRAIGLLAAMLAGGCGGPNPEPSKATPDAAPAADVAAPAVDYDQPFDKAATDQIGEDQRLPPDRTIAGKPTAALRESVEQAWPTIRLTDATRKPVPWVVTLDTDTGPIEITLRPDLAPNHCRNFLALVKVGYYDGLRFDRIVHQVAEDPEGGRSEVRMVRFGCPTGTGDPGVGHIGYHLRSEFSEVKHGIGTVGFTRDADPSTAGVRLYITLAPTPVLDSSYTVIGRVSKGLDVVETIAAGKLLPPDVDPTRELPERPVTIRKATARQNP